MSLSRCILCKSSNIQSLTFNNIFIIKCNICEFQYIPNNNKYIGEDFFSSYFTKRNATKHTKLNELRKEQYKIDAKYLSKYITHNSNILDVGCSSGNFIFEIHNQYNLESLTGVDIDKSAIKEANSQYSDIAEFKNTNLLEVDSNEQFDFIPRYFSVFRSRFAQIYPAY